LPIIQQQGFRITTDLDSQKFQALLDQSTPFVLYRWIGSITLLILFGLRIIFAQGWYIGLLRIVSFHEIPG
jgi:hypothetical protein